MTKSSDSGIINHLGIVQRNEDNHVIIRISSASACSGCHAEGSCSLSGKEDKIVEVHGSYEVNQGDQVTVMMKQSMGFSALFLGYVIPVIAVFVMLIILSLVNASELISGTISLAVLIPYYSILFLFRKRINEKFKFTIKA